MTQNATSLAPFYKGWDNYQQLLTTALAPLSPVQLTLRGGPELRSIGEIATHIIGARVRWFHGLMEQGGTEIEPLGQWDRTGQPTRTAAELISGLEASGQMIQKSLEQWTPDDLEKIYSGTHEGEEYTLTRQWVIWHVIEHDLHHGGEISILLGIHGLTAPDL